MNSANGTERDPQLRFSPVPFFFSLGFAAQLIQVVFLREFLTTFYGSEIAVAIVLGMWMLWTAEGSFVAARFRSGAMAAVRGYLLATLGVCVVARGHTRASDHLRRQSR